MSAWAKATRSNRLIVSQLGNLGHMTHRRVNHRLNVTDHLHGRGGHLLRILLAHHDLIVVRGYVGGDIVILLLELLLVFRRGRHLLMLLQVVVRVLLLLHLRGKPMRGHLLLLGLLTSHNWVRLHSLLLLDGRLGTCCQLGCCTALRVEADALVVEQRRRVMMVVLWRLHHVAVVVRVAAHLLLHLLRRFIVHAPATRHLHHVILMLLLLLLSGKLKLLRGGGLRLLLSLGEVVVRAV